MPLKESAVWFVTLGATLLIGLGADVLGRRTRLPRVTLLLLLGFLVGPGVLDALPEGRETMFHLFADIALTMVGFLLGEKLGHVERGPERRRVFAISISVVVLTALIVLGGLLALGAGLVMALLLAGISAATDPAATTDVVREQRAKGPFATLLLAIVAVDDAWGLLLFSVLLGAAEVVAGDGGGAVASLVEAGRELGGALLLGAGLGAVMAYLTGRIAEGEPTILEAVGLVFLACGLALFLEVSFILTAMVMGTVVARLARHHERPFHVIENIELPFMIIFFVLAGASLEVGSLGAIGWLGLAYLVLRALGRVVGGWAGARLSGAPAGTGRIGLALMPQAGVALGMALHAAERLPEVGDFLLQITIGATVIFELTGPIVTRAVLRREAVVTSACR